MNRKTILLISLPLLIFLLIYLIGIKLFFLTILIIFILGFFVFLFLHFLKWQLKRKGSFIANYFQYQQLSETDNQLELAILKEKMNTAVTSLKTSTMGLGIKGKAALYALPWYIVIGPSAAGKSTLLRHSGLKFPFNQGEEIQIKGYGGTRNCDWWFADEAILLDTAGRYTTEDHDHEEWFSFLSLLKRYRKKRPIDGVILAMSLEDLFLKPEKLEWHVSVIRKRVGELYQELGFEFPIHLVITKFDLLYGFEEFFIDLEDEKRSQVWGVTNFEAKIFFEHFQEEKGQLLNYLNAQQLRKITLEKNLERKNIIFNFPSQFEHVLVQIQKFIELLTAKNPYQTEPMITGLFFTSSDQEKELLKKIKFENNGQATIIQQQNKWTDKQNGSYFVKSLFKEILFKYHKTLIGTYKTKKIKRIKQLFLNLLFGMAIILIVMLFYRSYQNNRFIIDRALNSVDQLSATIEQSGSMNHAVMTALIPLGEMSDIFQKNSGLSGWINHIGYANAVKLNYGLSRLAGSIMRTAFQQNTADHLLHQLKHYQTQWDQLSETVRHKKAYEYYQLLKAYLLISYPNRIHGQSDYSLLANNWKKIVTTNYSIKITSNELKKLIALYYLKNKYYFVPDSEMINVSRSDIGPYVQTTHFYENLKSYEFQQRGNFPLSEFIDKHYDSLFQSFPVMPAMFTKNYYNKIIYKDIEKVIKNGEKNNWVLSGELSSLSIKNVQAIQRNNDKYIDNNKIQSEIKLRYLEDYQNTWVNFLNSVNLIQFISLEDGIDKLTFFNNHESPILKLLVIANHHLSVLSQQTVDLSNPESLFEGLIFHSRRENYVSSYLSNLTSIQSDIKRLILSSNQSDSAHDYAKAIFQNSDLDSPLYKTYQSVISMTSSIQDEALKYAVQHVLLLPVQESWRIILDTALKRAEEAWQQNVMPAYRDSIENKYPFSLRSKQEATTEDVLNFLQLKNGILWQFINDNFRGYLVFNKQQWQIRKWLTVGGDFSSHFIKMINVFQEVSQILIHHNKLSVELQIYPIPNPQIKELILQIGNNIYRYSNGPEVWKKIKWQGNDNDNFSKLSVITAQGNKIVSKSYFGLWGFFRLVQQAKIQRDDHDCYQLMWKLINGTKPLVVKILVRKNSHNDFIHAFFLTDYTFQNRILNHQGDFE